MAPASSEQTVRLLRGLTVELHTVHDLAERLEGLAASCLGQGAPDAAMMVELQRLDLLRQSLRALSGFTDGLAAGQTPDAALDGVFLEDMAARLRAALTGETIQTSPRPDDPVFFE